MLVTGLAVKCEHFEGHVKITWDFSYCLLEELNRPDSQMGGRRDGPLAGVAAQEVFGGLMKRKWGNGIKPNTVDSRLG